MTIAPAPAGVVPRHRLRAAPRRSARTAAYVPHFPPEHRYVSTSVALSVLIHVVVAGLVCAAITLLTLTVLIEQKASVAQSGPAAPTVNMELISDTPPTPPAPRPAATAPTIPLPVTTQPAIPLPAPTFTAPHPSPPTPDTVARSLSPTEAPKTLAKTGGKPKPKFTAVHATSQGKSADISPPHVGSAGFPAPGYPPDALAMRQTGTVGMEVAFGPDGRVKSAEVRSSSGFRVLDKWTRDFIYSNWKDASRANTTVDVPVIYFLR